MVAMPRDTIADLFASFAEFDEPFLAYDDGYRSHSYTYRQTADAARSFARRLESAGIGKGDSVVFWGENRPEWIAAFWGCVLRGALVVPLDYRSSPELLQRVQTIAKAKLLLAGEEVASATIAIPTWKFASVEWPSTRQDYTPVEISRNDIAEILFTSGATAEPKGVIIQHKNILANVVPVEREMQKYKKYAKPFHPIRFLNLLPLSHMFGQAMATFIPPMLPGVVVFMRGYNPHDIARQIKTRRISVMVCVPKILDVLREYVLRVVPEAAQTPAPGTHWMKRWWMYRRVHNLLGWKFWAFVVGAAPLPPELEEFWGRLGFVVIQGYGLTETAPIVTLNHPFHTRKGTVGKPIAGVEVKISDDGEILVRGENVTSGYLNPDAESAKAFEGGWFRTGDIGSIDEFGRLSIRGRKKEMIVTADGLNIFPEDVEGVLNEVSGVHDSAVVGVTEDGRERVHAVLVLDTGIDAADVVRNANARLEDHQRVRGYSVWTAGELPRTEGTRKLKRREIRSWVMGTGGPAKPAIGDEVESVIAQYAPGRKVTPETTLEELGLSSLERVELLMALERRFGATIDEGAYAECKRVSDLKQLLSEPILEGSLAQPALEPADFPTWNRTGWAYWIRRINLPLWILPLARVFTWVRAEGVEHLGDLEGPVIFAPNHQSHLDVPALMLALPAKWRYRITPAMSKEFFDAHFHPERHTSFERFTNGLNYYLSTLVFNAFPLPQREAGTRQSLRYAGGLVSDGWCIVIFPEGRITDTGEIARFMPGVGMMGSRLEVPVVPVKLVGLDKVLHRTWRMARPGRVTVKFGPALRLAGDDYAALAKRVEDAVRRL